MTIGVKIKKIKKVEKSKTKVYDIEVEDVHHYIFDDGTLSHNSYVPTKEMSGGSGLKYSASTIIFLSKKKEKDGTDLVGNIIKCEAKKSRLTREGSKAEVRLFFDERGLEKYYGLLELAERANIWKVAAGRYEVDGKKIYGKEILKNPEKYFTEDIMNQLEKQVKREFLYGAVDEGED